MSGAQSNLNKLLTSMNRKLCSISCLSPVTENTSIPRPWTKRWRDGDYGNGVIQQHCLRKSVTSLTVSDGRSPHEVWRGNQWRMRIANQL